jgi:excisionase family DNA binding protein
MLTHTQPPPSAVDVAIARSAGRVLSNFQRGERPVLLRVQEQGREEPIELPAGAVTMLMEILEAMAAGRGMVLMPQNAELTTVQAADLLNVSRPFLIKLLEERKLPYRKVGKHRRVLMEDVLAYKEKIDREREAVLEALAREGQELGHGYE